MIRPVLRADGSFEEIEVGNDFDGWNKVIGTTVGEIVPVHPLAKRGGPPGCHELWVDENALLREDVKANLMASVLAGKTIYGDVIVFEEGDID